SARLWRALAGQPPQTFSAVAPVELAGRRDAAGLLRVAVGMGAQPHAVREVDAVFDTGADLTTLARSLADSIGVVYPSTDSLPIEGVAARSWGRAAVIPVLRLGTATLGNVPALVLPDSALAFPSIGYSIQTI